MASRVVTTTPDALPGAISADQTVVVFISSRLSGPCRMLAPFFDELSSRYASIQFLKVRCYTSRRLLGPWQFSRKHSLV
jgi:thiol-disulfide isomerase/thioredoxin